MYKIGDTVRIRVCNFNGLVIDKSTVDEVTKFEVTFPNEDGMPVSRWFMEIELEDAQNNVFGFKK
jgi:hypothetical protein